MCFPFDSLPSGDFPACLLRSFSVLIAQQLLVVAIQYTGTLYRSLACAGLIVCRNEYLVDDCVFAFKKARAAHSSG
jgi:hypothetical protein